MLKIDVSQARQFEYDPDGRIKKTVLPETGETTYTYDEKGRISSKVDARKRKTVYEYDPWGSIAQREAVSERCCRRGRRHIAAGGVLLRLPAVAAPHPRDDRVG